MFCSTSNICSKTRTLILCAILPLALLGCVTHSAPILTRPAPELPEELAAPHKLRNPVKEEFLVPVSADRRIFRGVVRCGKERAEFHFVSPKTKSPNEKAPFLLCLPILGGGGDLMQFIAEVMAERGFAVAWTKRPGSALRQGQHGHELNDIFARTVRWNRMVLAWARRQPGLAADAQGLLGLSSGGFVGTVLLALEPTLLGGVISLAGADIADIALHSTEGRIVRWRRSRAAADGAGKDMLLRELRRELQTEPAHYAPYVETDRVFLVGARLDTVVPQRNRDLLWESFGRPERLTVPLAHYTSVFALGRILSRTERFLKSRLAAR